MISTQMYAQTKYIEELPACIFVDAMQLLMNKRASMLDDQKNRMHDNSLKSYCKAFFIEDNKSCKIDQSYAEMN